MGCLGLEEINVLARAKINFSIDVLRKRTDGYHDLRMIMQSLELCDDVLLRKQDKGIRLSCDRDCIPVDSTNTAFKAAKLFLDDFGIKDGVKIQIKKRIPDCAGLAGGSSDAAAVLNGLNSLFNIGATKEKLCEIGVKVGADVPFCVHAGTMLSEGIGDRLTRLKNIEGVDILIAKPVDGISTAQVYNNLDLENIQNRPHTDGLINSLEKGRMRDFYNGLKNVLEPVAMGMVKDVVRLKDELNKLGAIKSLMSGSGSAVFGIFEDETIAQKAFDSLSAQGVECYLTRTWG